MNCRRRRRCNTFRKPARRRRSPVCAVGNAGLIPLPDIRNSTNTRLISTILNSTNIVFRRYRCRTHMRRHRRSNRPPNSRLSRNRKCLTAGCALSVGRLRRRRLRILTALRFVKSANRLRKMPHLLHTAMKSPTPTNKNVHYVHY